MYYFHNSTDTLKFWTEKRAIIKLFCFSSDFDETWWSCSTHFVLQFHQISSKLDEKQKVLLIARFSVQNFKVSVELWKSYIVGSGYMVEYFYTSPALVEWVGLFSTLIEALDASLEALNRSNMNLEYCHILS